MANISPLIDSMIKEYLLFRGFTSTLKAFEGEIKADKDKSFRVLLRFMHAFFVCSFFLTSTRTRLLSF